MRRKIHNFIDCTIDNLTSPILYFGNVALVILSFFAGYYVFAKLNLFKGSISYINGIPKHELYIAITMGGIISIAVIIDIIPKFIRTENKYLPLIICAFLLFIAIICASEWSNVYVASASFAGCFFTSLAVSKTLREQVIKSGKETQWTIGHICGTGVVPFIAGIFCFFSKSINLISFSQDTILMKLIPLTISLVIMFTIAVLISLHRWYENNSDDKLKEEMVLINAGDTVKNIQNLPLSRRLLRYYMLILYLFPFMIASVYLLINPSPLFLLLSYSSFMLVMIFFYDYPNKIIKNKHNILISVRITAVYLLVSSITLGIYFNNFNYIPYYLDFGDASVFALSVAVSGIVFANFYKKGKSEFYKKRIIHMLTASVLTFMIMIFINKIFHNEALYSYSSLFFSLSILAIICNIYKSVNHNE